MPKTKKRKSTVNRPGNGNTAAPESQARELPARAARGSILSVGGQSLQNVVFSVMVSLGCWGMAFFFAFLSNGEPNHELYGGIMAVTALIWSLIAVRRWSMYRQRA